MILKVTIHCDLSETEAKFHFFFKTTYIFYNSLAYQSDTAWSLHRDTDCFESHFPV